MPGMRRRELITLLSGAAVTWPLAASAQQPAMPVIGFMSARSPEDTLQELNAFHKGLGEGGFIEHRNTTIEYRWARGDYARLPVLAAELVQQRVNVLVATGGDASALAAKAATATIPVVFNMSSDPVKAGLVESFNRPGGNATGCVIRPNPWRRRGSTCCGKLFPPSHSSASSSIRITRLQPAICGMSKRLRHRLASAFSWQRRAPTPNWTLPLQRFFGSASARCWSPLAPIRHAPQPDYRLCCAEPASGHLPVPPVCVRRRSDQLWAEHHRCVPTIGVYTARILKGAAPADLPVMQPTKFDFIINLKTAKALRLEIPPTVSARADEVIQ